MTVNINSILNKLKDETGYPTNEGVYKGKEDKYITYVYSDEHCTLYADNSEQALQADIQLTFYCPDGFNYHATKKQIKEYLIDKGFQIESVQSFLEPLSDETLLRHTVFEINYTIS